MPGSWVWVAQQRLALQGIKKMKAACQLAAQVLQQAGTLVKVR